MDFFSEGGVAGEPLVPCFLIVAFFGDFLSSTGSPSTFTFLGLPRFFFVGSKDFVGEGGVAGIEPRRGSTLGFWASPIAGALREPLVPCARVPCTRVGSLRSVGSR